MRVYAGRRRPIGPLSAALVLAITIAVSAAPSPFDEKDPWFYIKHVNYASKYWHEEDTRRIWLPSIPHDDGSTRSPLAPPDWANITTATIPLLRWRVNGSCFFLITSPEFPRDPGTLLYIPKADLIPGHFGANAGAAALRLRPRAARPTPLVLQTPSTTHPTPPAARPSVEPLVGLHKNPAAAMLLSSRYLSSYAPITDRSSLMVPRGPNTATQNNPRGLMHVPPASPGKRAPRVRLEDLRARNFRNTSRTWLDVGELFRKPAKYVYRSPSAGTWPLEIRDAGELVFGCDSALVRVRYGRDFMGLVISMKNSTPAEVLVAPLKTHLYATSPDMEMLPGPPPGPRYRVFLISSINGKHDHALVSALADVAAYPEDSANYAQHISRAYAEFFKSAPGVNLQGGANAPLFWRMSGLMATAGMSLLDSAHSHGATSLTSLVRFMTHMRILAELASRGAAGCTADSLFLRVNLWPETALGKVESALKRLALEALKDSERGLSAAAQAYELAFAAGSGATTADIVFSASAAVADIYREFVFGRGLGGRSARRALFFASALILEPVEAGEASSEQLERARMLLLRVTSMCTSDVAAAANARIREVLDDETDHMSSLFWAPDHFSPCAASLRFDLTESAFILDALAQAQGTKVPVDVMETRTRSIASALTRWSHRSTLVRAFMPEPQRTCGGGTASAPEPRMIIPIARDASFVVTHAPMGRGIEYKLAGVDVRRPLYLTYITTECGSRAADVEPRRLARHESSFDVGLVGSVFLRYTPAGEVTAALAVDTEDAQRKLVGGSKEGEEDVFSSDVPSTALLLFPNGTVINLLAFDTIERPSIPTGYIVASGVGVILIAAAISGIGRVLWSFAPVFWRNR
ncbi:envelope glycoprotein H [Bovine alphaherpesvirus 2]|uniref:Envelope glycoprotein H n=1 Tax=Bovine alphaherpesvirus 2 TaxID=10295 RepID=A0ABX6WQI1_9ALPH|nr:envelope glycoprotein H [Bovine alphaherpesvirus 2]QPO25155.1 envelope glycoprotein H [Bovine alphaherpesvirus 2]